MEYQRGRVSYRGLFGTDGIRGRAGQFPMTSRMALLVGQAMVAALDRERPTIVLGRDTRYSGPVLQAALAAGLTSAGARVLDAGVFPTGGISLLCREVEADGGAVVSASHNPAPDNGIKLLGPGGTKLSAAVEARIEEHLEWLGGQMAASEAVSGVLERLEAAAELYEGCLSKASGLQPGDLEGFRFVVDCAHGAAHHLAPKVLRDLGAAVRTIGAEPDGRNINRKCGSQHLSGLVAEVRRLGYDGGLAFDGDADRLILVDEEGRPANGDQLLALLATDWQRQGRLHGNVVVGTVMSNFALESYLNGLGLELLRTRVGDKYVRNELRARGANLGGEQSGHLLFPEYCPTGDGLLTGLLVLRTWRDTGGKLSELTRIIEPTPQVLHNVPVREKVPLAQLPGLRAEERRQADELRGKGRILLRYSGTENLLRIMVEGTDQDLVERAVQSLVQAAQRELGLN